MRIDFTPVKHCELELDLGIISYCYWKMYWFPIAVATDVHIWSCWKQHQFVILLLSYVFISHKFDMDLKVWGLDSLREAPGEKFLPQICSPTFLGQDPFFHHQMLFYLSYHFSLSLTDHWLGKGLYFSRTHLIPLGLRIEFKIIIPASSNSPSLPKVMYFRY